MIDKNYFRFRFRSNVKEPLGVLAYRKFRPAYSLLIISVNTHCAHDMVYRGLRRHFQDEISSRRPFSA